MKPVLERLAKRTVVDSAGCWVFQGTKNGGYGSISIATVDGKPIRKYAHRVTWESKYGPVPEGLQLDHLCRNRACCNPDHLEPVTPSENIQRARALITHCPQGHSYSPENTYTSRGRRSCKTCVAARTRARRARQKES